MVFPAFWQEERLAQLADHVRHGRATVLATSRHRNKLRLGHLAGNRFRLGLAGLDEAATRTDLQRLMHEGIRHRFGAQRFGVNGATLRIARAWGAGDFQAAVAAIIDPSDTWRWGDPFPDGWRGGAEGRVLGAVRAGSSAKSALHAGGDQLAKLVASAAQSAVFNAILDARVAQGLLHVLRVGDIACTTKGAPFVVVEADLADVNRCATPGLLDIRATAPLPGDLRLRPSPEREAEEQAERRNSSRLDLVSTRWIFRKPRRTSTFARFIPRSTGIGTRWRRMEIQPLTSFRLLCHRSPRSAGYCCSSGSTRLKIIRANP